MQEKMHLFLLQIKLEKRRMDVKNDCCFFISWYSIWSLTIKGFLHFVVTMHAFVLLLCIHESLVQTTIASTKRKYAMEWHSKQQKWKERKYQEHGYSCIWAERKSRWKCLVFHSTPSSPLSFRMKYSSSQIVFWSNIKMWKWDALKRQVESKVQPEERESDFRLLMPSLLLKTHSHTRRFQFMSLFDNSIFVKRKQRR